MNCCCLQSCVSSLLLPLLLPLTSYLYAHHHCGLGSALLASLTLLASLAHCPCPPLHHLPAVAALKICWGEWVLAAQGLMPAQALT